MSEPSHSEFLSKNMQSLREKNGLTQSALAIRAKVPRSTITHMESGSGNPSLKNIVKVCTALNVSVEELLAKPRADVHFVKNSDVPAKKVSGGLGLVRKLLPHPIPGMEFDQMEYEAGARKGGVPHLPGTKEYITVVRGELTLTLGDGQEFTISKGDVLAFPGDQKHLYENRGKSKVHAISVVVLAPMA